MADAGDRALFDVRGLTHRYHRSSPVAALDDASLTVREGRSMGIVGESGSGKTTLTRAMLGLLRPTSGTVVYRGQPVPIGRGRGSRAFRGRVQLVLQDPYSALNPRMTVGDIIGEPLQVQQPRRDHSGRVAELLTAVELDPDLARRRPHQLSGGQRQRVAIARALGPRPEVVIADEPVSALDVSVRRNVLRLLRRLVEHERLTLVVVSHDLGIVQRLCSDVVVMQSGRVIERGATSDVLDDPRHPYTRDLIASIPPLPERRANP